MTENLQQQRERNHQKNLDRLKRFRPIDDTFMRGMFHQNRELVEFVLQTILEKKDLRVLSSQTQMDAKRVTGARSICLDVYAIDAIGKVYNIEVQKDCNEANPKRIRYHSSVLDIENLDVTQDFDNLPETYVIFITEKDYFGAGKPIYAIEETVVTTGQLYGDGRHILYVNASYQDRSTDIGKLMHDFLCNDAKDMLCPLMKKQTAYLKESQKGVTKMCEIMEELRAEGFEEGRSEGLSEGLSEGRKEGNKEGQAAIIHAIYNNGLSLEQISDMTNISLAEVTRIIKSKC